MCGIVVAVFRKNIVSVLLKGLHKLEYRGYDSSGVAVLNGDVQCSEIFSHSHALIGKRTINI